MIEKYMKAGVICGVLMICICGSVAKAMYNEQSQTDIIEVAKEEPIRYIEDASPSGEKYAYVNEYFPNEVNIQNKLNGNEKVINVEDDLHMTNSIGKIEWLDDENLIIISHINPSLNYLSLYNIEKDLIVDGKYGSDFTWNDGDYSSLIYIEHAPHFSGIVGGEKILNSNDEIVYKTAENESIISLDSSSDGKNICFFIYNEKKEQADLCITDTTIVIDINSKQIDRKKWDNDIGNIAWDTNTGIVVKTRTSKTEVDPQTITVIKKTEINMYDDLK